MATTTINRQTLKVIRADIEAALRTVEQKHGFTFAPLGSISFSREGDWFRTKIEARSGAAKPKEDRSKEEFELYARSFGVDPKKFGTTFSSHSMTFTVCGIKPRSQKYPILAKNAQGKVYKFPASVIGGKNFFSDESLMERL